MSKKKVEGPREIWKGTLNTMSVRMIYIPDKDIFILERDTGVDSLGAHQWVRWTAQHYQSSSFYPQIGVTNIPAECADFQQLIRLFGEHLLGR